MAVQLTGYQQPGNRHVKSCIHTGTDTHPTTGSRIQLLTTTSQVAYSTTKAPAVGQVVQHDKYNPTGYADYWVCGQPVANNFCLPLGVITEVNSSVNAIKAGTTADVSGGRVTVKFKGLVQARCVAVDVAIAVGSQLVWNSAEPGSFREATAGYPATIGASWDGTSTTTLKADVATALYDPTGTTGEGIWIATALEAVSTAESSGASTPTWKLIWVELMGVGYAD